MVTIPVLGKLLDLVPSEVAERLLVPFNQLVVIKLAGQSFMRFWILCLLAVYSI